MIVAREPGRDPALPDRSLLEPALVQLNRREGPPLRRIGVTAVDLLMSAADDPAERHVPSNLVFQPELVARASTLG